MKYELDPDTTRTTAWIWLVVFLIVATITVAVLVGEPALR